VVPVYLAHLQALEIGAPAMKWLEITSFWLLVLALGVGSFIIIGAMLRGHRELAPRGEA
jgi:hypothetical protein